MAEPNRRIIVDGVEFSQLVEFPKIFRAVTGAMQPARLAIALLMITALITLGRVWDGLTDPRVDPEGLAAGVASEDELQTHQAALRQALRSFGDTTTQEPFETDEVLGQVQAGYRTQLEGAAGESETSLRRLNENYIAALNLIDDTRPRGVFEASASFAADAVQRVVRGVLTLSPLEIYRGLGNLFIDLPRLLWANHKWFLAIYGLLFVIVVAMGGGAICRMAAWQVATQERLRVREAVDFAAANTGRLVAAHVLPAVIASILALVIVAMGVLMLVPALDVVGALIYGLALVLGFIVAFVLIGFLLGFPLLAPAVAIESGDGTEAMQRAYAYVVTRPLYLIGYWIIALIGLAIGYFVVALIAALAMNFTASLFSLPSDNPALIVAGGYEPFRLSQTPVEAAAGSWHHQWAAWVIAFWETVVVCLVAAYVLSYHFSASSIMYLLMRRACDGQDVQEISQAGAADSVSAARGAAVSSPSASATTGSTPSGPPAKDASADQNMRVT